MYSTVSLSNPASTYSLLHEALRKSLHLQQSHKTRLSTAVQTQSTNTNNREFHTDCAAILAVSECEISWTANTLQSFYRNSTNHLCAVYPLPCCWYYFPLRETFMTTLKLLNTQVFVILYLYTLIDISCIFYFL